MVRRDRHDIVMEILKSLKSGRKKTQTMKDVNLSFVQAQQYLGILLEKGLIEKTDDKVFKTTTSGLKFIEKCEDCLLSEWHRQGKSKLND